MYLFLSTSIFNCGNLSRCSDIAAIRISRRDLFHVMLRGETADERWKLLGYPFFLSGESSRSRSSRCFVRSLTRLRRGHVSAAFTQLRNPDAEIFIRTCVGNFFSCASLRSFAANETTYHRSSTKIIERWSPSRGNSS